MHRDSNELFVFQVYKNGKALKGSYASAASFYGNIAGAELTEVPQALVLYRYDKTSAYDTDDTIRNKVRLGILKNYLEKYDLKFRVLLDDYHYNSKNSGLTYFRVADDYSSDWSSQFYLIDKKGMVRYNSYIIPGGFKGFTRDFSKALNIFD